MSAPISTGTIPFPVGDETFQTYYKLVGTLEGRTKRPLVVLHGGPGFSHDYLIPMADLAEHGRPIVFYDQIGSGRSSTMPDKPETFWTIDLFIAELFNLLAHFRIEDEFDALGHSWGGILLSEVMLRRKPAGLKHAVLSNTICHMHSFSESRMTLGKTLPEWAQEEMKKGRRNTPECRAALAEFGKLYQCRLEDNPPERTLSRDYGFKNIYVMQSMSANQLRGWSCVDRLHEIMVPCLVVNGRYDVAQDWTLAPLFKHLPRVKWVKFESERSSHSPYWEDRERYMQIVGEFLEY